MLFVSTVFLLLVAASVGQLGVPRSVQGEWVIADEDAYEDADVPLGAEEDNMWPDTPTEHIKNILVEDVMSPTPLDVLNEKEPEKDDISDSAVWKIVLVFMILLMSLMGCLSVAYYLCVWRGGRIHYHKHVST